MFVEMRYITIGKRAVPLWVILIICVMIGVVVALTAFGTMQISYRVVPSTQAPTLTPNPIQVNLGDIVSGSTGSKDFGKVGTMSLPVGYTITFELDTSTIQNHFNYFYAYIDIYKDTSYVYSLILSLTYTSTSVTLSSGSYDLYLKVSYTAKSISSTVSGTAVITLKYPE